MSRLNYFVLFASIFLISAFLVNFASADVSILTSSDSYELTDPLNALNVDTNSVLSNDDSRGIITSLSVVNGLLYGSFYEGLYNNGSFVYITNELDFHGVDYFDYTATDGDSVSNPTRVVIGVNDTAPVAVEDKYSTSDGSLVVDNMGGVLANDADSDLDTIYSNLVQDVHNGTLTLNDDGSFNYNANKPNGVDFFQYQSTDLYKNSNIVYSTILIGTNTAPTATADVYNYNLVNNSFEVDSTNGVLTNDADADGDILFATLVDDSSLNGTLNFNSDGSFTYTPSEGKQWNGIETFTYQATDLDLSSETVTVKIYVNYTEPVVETSTPSRGGGGGSASRTCVTTWNCSVWSECSNGVQLRTCEYQSGLCAPIAAKPALLQTCENVAGNQTNTTNPTVNTNTEAPGLLAGLTGAVIGSAAGQWSLGIIIFLIIVGIVYKIIVIRRRHAVESIVVKKVKVKKS